MVKPGQSFICPLLGLVYLSEMDLVLLSLRLHAGHEGCQVKEGRDSRAFAPSG